MGRLFRVRSVSGSRFDRGSSCDGFNRGSTCDELCFGEVDKHIAQSRLKSTAMKRPLDKE